jgi:hypothetical protein
MTRTDCEDLSSGNTERFIGLTPLNDPVNHPAHYTQGGIECIEALKAALGFEGFKSYCRGNIIKYLWRTEHKNKVQDLKKARWYLDRLIEESEK